MRYGSPYSSGYGSPDNHFVYAYVDPVTLSNTSFVYRCLLRDGWGDCYVQLYVNGICGGTYFATEGQELAVTLPIPYGAQSMSCMPLRVGKLNDNSYSDSKVVLTYESLENSKVTLGFTFVPEILPALDDDGYTSDWSLTGLVYGQNCATVNGHKTWAQLTIETVIDAGVITIQLKNRGIVMAEGSALVADAPFPVTFVSKNGSGLSGSVTISDSVIDFTGSLDIRWPVYASILRNVSSPPTTSIIQIYFDGNNDIRWTDPAALTAQTYYYRIVPYSDTGVTGTPSSIVSILPILAPVPVTELAYTSGNAAATVIGFNRSTTAGATYRVYGATAINGVANMNTPIATASSGTPGAATTITLPAITGYAGTAYFLVRAVNSGVEERNQNVLAIEYDASGNYIPSRPNSPGMQQQWVTITSGRAISIQGSYDTAGQKGIGTLLKLFYRTPEGSYDYSLPVGSGGILSTQGQTKLGTITYTFNTDGFYYVRLLAATAAGVLSDYNNAQELLIYVSDDTISAVTDLTAELSRS